MPAPETGASAEPNLTVVETPRRKRRQPSALTKAQEKEVTLTLALCAAAVLPDYAGLLENNEVSPQSIVLLKADAEEVQRKGRAAINCTTAKEGFTAEEGETKSELMEHLRKLQSAARTRFSDSEPERLGNYLIGHDIDSSRPALESSAQTIIDQANADRPGSVDTVFITQSNIKRDSYVNSQAGQLTEQAAAKQARQERNAMMDTIRERRKKIQRAIDTEFPYTGSGSAKARTLFHLPSGRPYSY